MPRSDKQALTATIMYYSLDTITLNLETKIYSETIILEIQKTEGWMFW